MKSLAYASGCNTACPTGRERGALGTQLNEKITANVLSSDAELWKRVVANELPAFAKVVERYQGAVVAVAFSQCGTFAYCMLLFTMMKLMYVRVDNEFPSQSKGCFAEMP